MDIWSFRASILPRKPLQISETAVMVQGTNKDPILIAKLPDQKTNNILQIHRHKRSQLNTRAYGHPKMKHATH